nr:hypothetical protein CFP56_77325 [Quercus suber]
MELQDVLERAAADVLQILKGISELQDASIAVIGGLALRKYLPNGRRTEVFVFHSGWPCELKSDSSSQEELPSPYQAAASAYISQSLYLPVNAVKLKDLPENTVPYISAFDLILFKIHSCGLRAQLGKRIMDAQDAESLISSAAVTLPLTLTQWQKDQMEPCIADLVSYGSKNATWWRQHLGMPARK